MKHIHFIATFLVCLFTISLQYLNAQIPEDSRQILQSEITAATVYLNAAEVQRTTKAQLSSGTHQIVFTNLSNKMDKKSVQLSTSKGVEILSISVRHKDKKLENKTLFIQEKEDSIELINDQITLLNNDLAAYKEEKQLLQQNKSIGGTQTGVSISELKQAADFYRIRMKDIHQLQSEAQKQIKEQRTLLSEIRHRLQKPLSKWNTPKKELLATIEVKSPQSIDFELKYLVTDALWSPSYNLRATDITQPVRLEYQAQVYNNTGSDWKNVQLKLSTADPTQTASKPQLEVWTLNHQQKKSYGEGISNARPSAYAYDTIYTFDPVSYEEKPQIIRNEQAMQEIEVGELSTEFEIEKKYDIPSTAIPYQVTVTEYDLDATYKHFCIPKLDKGVFLLAQVTGWTDLNLIAGPAKIYYQDTYMGESRIETSGIRDTLDLSLGRDEKVVVTRTKRQDESGKKFLGLNTKETFLYEISLKNNRSTSIQVEIQDQIPVAQEKDIHVDAIELSNAEQDELSGRLLWRYNLKAGESEKFDLSFSVKYPKGKKVMIRKSKRISSPRFF
ncbi:MAG: DUF4139 domain-containing protein [Chitinophagales bacterium]